MENNKLSVEPYKGVRDFYPDEMRVQNYIFAVMRRAVESYGFEEYNASILEESALYRAKTGEEIVNEQTYNFVDRGGREVTIRPEMTPTVARMVAKKRKELVFPLRWYSIPNNFRYERPQRGRLREHWQLNADIFGVDSIEADVEVVMLAAEILKKFGADEKQYEIRINHRGLTNFMMKNYLGLDEEVCYKLSKLIDRKQKIKEEVFLSEAKEYLGEKVDKFMNFFQLDIDKLPEEIFGCEGKNDLVGIMDYLNKRGISNWRYDPTLIRGFDYYTKMVFEVFDLNPKNNRSLFGGGRYDDLVSIFGVEKVAGVGFGMGDVTIKDFLEIHQLMPQLKSSSDLYIGVFSERYFDQASDLADKLRKAGVKVVVDLSKKKIGHQIKLADKNKVPFFVCVGEDETNTKRYKLKSMFDKKEFDVDEKGMIELIKGI